MVIIWYKFGLIHIKHEPPRPRTTLIRIIDKEVRHKLSQKKKRDYSYDLVLTEWFATRLLASSLNQKEKFNRCFIFI